MNLPIRPRRNRRNPSIRSLVRETVVTPGDLIQPLFVHAGIDDQPIASMPGCTRWSLDGLVREAGETHALGVPAVVIFPAIEESLKTPGAEEAWNPQGLVPRAIRALKQAHPTLCVITDVALDPYNADGHDGLVRRSPDGELEILNDETVEVLCRQALCHAEAGADIVAPSDMMDGRAAAIRQALDAEGHEKVSILAYTAKYASAYYGPFRDAAESAPAFGDRRSYQMDPANAREARREALLDVDEGADMIMVKPAGPYQDVIRDLRDRIDLPLAAYQVSGEMAMIEAAAERGWVDRDRIILESLTGIVRSGADIVITYFALDAARLIKEQS
jgi:porphobilinogen synthase